MTESKSHKEKQYLKQYQYVWSIISVFDLPAGEILVGESKQKSSEMCFH